MNTRFIARGLFSLLAGLSVAACSDTIVEGGRPHTAELTVDRTTAQVGDTLLFNLEGTGELLAGVAIEYGDGAADTLATQGAVTAGFRREHAYAEAGTYIAVGTVVDGTTVGLVELKDSVTVVISGGGT